MIACRTPKGPAKDSVGNPASNVESISSEEQAGAKNPKEKAKLYNPDRSAITWKELSVLGIESVGDLEKIGTANLADKIIERYEQRREKKRDAWGN